ncbi:putative ribonuclease H-like domain-containing protein, partial [Tanacetum coccineum]
NPQMDLHDQGVIDSGFSRHMTGNMSYLTYYEEIDEGYVAFGRNPKGRKRVPRKNNMYSVDLKNIIPKGGLTFLFAKATSDESKLWHRRLGHLNFKTMNKLVKANLVRGLPSKLFENDQTYVTCQKGKQHRTSCKSKTENSTSLSLHLLHMDLFVPTFVKSLMKKMYCLVVTDDYSRFTWVFFLATKDETSGILKSFITRIENLVDHKGILRQYSVARTPQQNGVAKRRNRILIKAARTILADSKLPTTFWAEAINTACYVQNRVLVVKPHNKTPYELFHGRTPTLSFMRPFGCHVTIGKFDGKADEGFFVGYSLNSKAFRVFNSRTRIVEENLHIRFSKSTPNIVGSGPDCLFNIDALTRTMNYKLIVAGTQSNIFVGTKASDNAGQARKETEPVKNYILLPLWPVDLPFSQDPKSSQVNESKPSSDDKKVDEDPRKVSESIDQEKDDNVNSTNNVIAASINEVNAISGKTSIELPDDPNMSALEDISIFDLSRDNEDGDAKADMNNLDTTIQVSPIPTTRIHKDHPLNQEEPKKVIHALKDPSWIEAMQEELLQFKLQEVWTLVDLPNGKRAIGSKWVFRNKKDEKEIVIRNKARLVAQGYTKKEGIDYDEVFAPIARIEVIRLFLAYASFKDFVVYQMDVKSAFLYGKIEEEVYVCQPPGFEDPNFPDRVYKVEKAMYGLHQALRAWYKTLSTYLLDNGFQRGKIDKTYSSKGTKMSSIGELTFFLGLQVQQKKDGIFISQDKYVAEILKKFGFTEVKPASTPTENQKPLHKDDDGKKVDVHMYRSMIGSLMYLTTSRPDIMSTKSRPLVSKDSPFDLIVYNDRDYAGACLDRSYNRRLSNSLELDLIRDSARKQHSDEDVHKELGDSLVRAATTASSLEVEQDSGMHPNSRGLMLLLQLEGIYLVRVMDINVSGWECFGEGGVGVGMKIMVEVINTAKLIIDAAEVSVAGDIVSAASAATTTTATINIVDDITLAQALEEMKSTKPTKKGIVIQELEPVKKKDQILRDEETALNLQAEFDEERLAIEKAKKEKEANIALIETWDDMQAKIDADH